MKSEHGYLLMSTLFFLVFTGLFTQMLIKISGNHIIQLRQFSEAYQAKAALNMSESILKQYIESNKEAPEKGKITTSIGLVNLQKRSEEEFMLKVTLANGMEYYQYVDIDVPVIEEPDPDLDPELDSELDPDEEFNLNPDTEVEKNQNHDSELEKEP